MSRLRSYALGLAGLGLVMSMTACTPSTTDANAAFCASSATVQTEVAKLKALATSSNATLDQISAQRDEVAKATSAAAKDAEKLADAAKKEVAAADNAFDQAIAAIPGTATVEEAQAAYKAAVEAWDKAMLSIRLEVGCK